MSDVAPLLLAGAAVTTGRVAEVRDPWSGEVVAAVSEAGPAEVDLALDAAWGARQLAAALPPHARADVLRRLGDLLRRDADALVAATVTEAGKPITLARAELQRGLETLADGAFAALALGGEVQQLGAVPGGAGRLGLVRRVPAGVVTAITPFNFPVNLVLHKLAPAIAAGCPVVLKPAPETPTAALHLGRLCVEAGLPPQAISVLPCQVAHARPLVEDERVAVVSFTGSAPVGWSLKRQATRARVLLELGGVAHNVVGPDVDVDAVARALAAGAFAYAGQSCVSVQHVHAHADVAEALTDALRRATEALPVGAPTDPDTVVGPVLRDRDADRVDAMIDDALATGARALTRRRRDGRLLAPVVLTGVTPGHRLWDEEVFGPVVAVHRWTDEDTLVARINGSRWGLQAGVFTRDHGLVMRLWARLEVGGVVHGAPSAWRADGMPYGGVKGSGIGREGPRHAVLELTEPRLLVTSAG